ncbi:DUF4153 domain-containing protein [Streptomyces sp. NRRL B-24484]|uniref:DUF4153 domain-containing protein n=1 Tax=Streptomyces sp. NRRL B-24484 TaxID=1463833 RepID=UPI000693F33C|nr:DUF4173 domain-containing protein [Streptomyces sp. NRRL B-24484]
MPRPGAGPGQAYGGRPGTGPGAWLPPAPPPDPLWIVATAPTRPALPGFGVLAAGLASGLLAAVLLTDGLGVNVLLWALVGAVGAGLAASATGRKVRPWTVVWTVTALVLLLVPALVEASWPVVLALLAAAGAGSLALHGGRRWPGVLLGPFGMWPHLIPGLAWGLLSLRNRQYPARDRVVSVAKAAAVSLALLVVFGALFASADAAVAELLGDLAPSIDTEDLPMQVLLFLVGLLIALAAAHTAAGPRRFDRFPVKPGRERGRLEWAVPLVALNLLFGAFVAVQAVVFVGGYESVMSKPGMIPAEYARQGFWQLLIVTLLVLVLLALAGRWAPRSTPRDRAMAKTLLGLLCGQTMVVVASALYRMQRYVDNFGLTRLRISVATVEIWLGVVLLLVLVGGILASAKWLPRAVVLSAAAATAVFGLISPDAVIAEQNVHRFEQTGRIDVGYLRDLSADAVPALDRLPEDQRVCALQKIAKDLDDDRLPWYATSLAESRARGILADRAVSVVGDDACRRVGVRPDDRYYGDGDY